MAKPTYYTLFSAHHAAYPNKSSFRSREEMYADIGYDFSKMSEAYRNTCALRMSMAFLNMGVWFHGRLKIKAGKFKGLMVELSASMLAEDLKKSRALGKTEVFKGGDVISKIGNRKGVIYFHHIDMEGGGHIDMYEYPEICNSECFFPRAKEVWFWELH